MSSVADQDGSHSVIALDGFAERESNIASASTPMKRFEIITEADARVLDYGSTVVAGRGRAHHAAGADTLKARRITVVRERRRRRCSTALAPRARHPDRGDRAAITRRVALKDAMRRSTCAAAGWPCTISAPTAAEPVDYPDTAARWRGRWRAARPTPGIVIDGAGLGSTIAANKVDGVRAAMCLNQTLARYARQHNGANVLALGATLVSAGRGAGDRRHLHRHADARAALHPAAGEDPRTSSADGSRTDRAWHDRRAAAPHQIIVEELAREPGARRRRRAAPATRSCTSAVPTGCRACSTPAPRGSGCTRRAARPAASRRMIDHTLLKPDATRAGHRDALPRGGRSSSSPRVCVNPTWVALCAQLLRGSGVGVCSVVGFPLGATTPDVEALRDAARDLRRRARDRHGDQRRRAQVRRPAASSSATSRR